VLLLFGTIALVIVAKNFYLLYSISHGVSDETVETLIMISTAITLTLVFVSAVIIFHLISDRINRLLEGMQDIKKGGYPMLRITGQDELSMLMRGFNDMVEELRTRDEKLKSWAGRRETELARLSQNLEVERGKLETVLQSIGEGVIVLDNENRVLMANRRVSEIFAIPAEELSGTDLSTLISHVRHRLLNSEKFDQEFEQLQRNTAAGEELVLQLDEPNGPEIRHEPRARAGAPQNRVYLHHLPRAAYAADFDQRLAGADPHRCRWTDLRRHARVAGHRGE
jgi:nitrogen fixation/metabolism regulation signal transduction histidine kinase